MNSSWPYEDMHVHSTFSDGAATLEQNIARARELGLRRITCVDHVRRDSDWLPEFVAAVADWKHLDDLEVLCGIEAKILDLDGNLDMPDDIAGVDRVYAADHQMPGPDGPIHPREVAERLAAAETTPARVVADLVTATANAMEGHRGLVVAHMFSLLPKMGLSEAQVPEGSLRRLARVARETDALIEIDERWSCPSLRSVHPFVEAGVPVLASTDSHGLESLGRFEYVWRCFSMLRLTEGAPQLAA